MSTEGYKAFGDLDGPLILTPQMKSRQQAAERIRDAVTRVHYHEAAEDDARYIGHFHGDDEIGHVHPPSPMGPIGHVHPPSPMGPSVGHSTPPAVQKRLDEVVLPRIGAMLSYKTPPSSLMQWRLRLYCGHVVEKTAHVDWKDAHTAFRPMKCPVCRQDPVVVVAARPLGRVAELEEKTVESAQVLRSKTQLKRHLALAQAEVERLEKELAEIDDAPPSPPAKRSHRRKPR